MTEFEAKQKGQAFLKKVKEAVGGNWTLRVWQNLGWHYALHLDRMNIYERFNRDTGKPYYSMLIANNNEHKSAGAGYYPHVSGDDIGAVVASQLSQVLVIEKERFEFAQDNINSLDEEKFKNAMLNALEK